MIRAQDEKPSKPKSKRRKKATSGQTATQSFTVGRVKVTAPADTRAGAVRKVASAVDDVLRHAGARGKWSVAFEHVRVPHAQRGRKGDE